MAPGFNVEDITNIAKRSYRLYDSNTPDWASAFRDHQELKNELFALHCALGHLARSANLERGQLSSKTNLDSHIQQVLDKLVAECSKTLQGLEEAANACSERAEQNPIALQPDNADQGLVKSAVIVQEESERNVNSIVESYQDKLRSHTDAINLVLNVFQWAVPKQGDFGNEGSIQAMQEFQQKVTDSNSELIPLVKELLARIETLPASNKYGNAEISGGYVQQGNFHGNMIVNYHFAGAELLPESIHARPHVKPLEQLHTAISPRRSRGRHISSTGQSAGLNVRSVSSDERYEAGQGSFSIAPTSLVSIAPMTNSSNNKSPHFPRVEPTSSRHGERYVSNDIPPAIMQLNLKRQQAGMEGTADFKHSSVPTSMPSFMSHVVPTIPELEQGLQYIFRPTKARFVNQHNSKMQLRESEIEKWTQGLSNALQSHHQSIPSTKVGARLLSAEQQTSYSGLLSSLNEILENTDTELRTSFYDASNAAGVGSVFDRLLTLTKSVRIEKEVSEFHEEREDFGWKA